MDLHRRLATTGDRLASAVRRRVEVDARSLAALRIALGLLVLADLALRSRDLAAFYTDAGVLPRTALLSRSDPLYLSVHLLSGDAWVQGALFALAAGFAVALAVGYRTSTATVASWILLVSLHNRMPAVLNGGDVLLRLLLFWGIFLPLGARWSVDGRQSARTRERVRSVASAALLVQVVAVYVANAAFKLGGDAWLRGEALAYVFSLGQFTVLLGDALGSFPAVLRALNYLWLAMVAGAVLLLVATGLRRTGLVVAYAAAHVGMALTLRLDLFPLVSVAALLPFLPGSVWDAAADRLARRRPVTAADRALTRLAGWLPTVSVSGVPPALARWKRLAVTVVPLAFLVLVVLWNVQVLGVAQVHGQDVVPAEAEAVVDLTRTDQYWNMFAPDPLSTDGWIVAPGRLENGSRVDAFHGGRVRWDRPPDVSATYPTARWRKYLVGLWRQDTTDRYYFARYLCRHWNRHHRSDLANVTVYFVEQPTRIDADLEPTERVRLERRRC